MIKHDNFGIEIERAIHFLQIKKLVVQTLKCINHSIQTADFSHETQ